MLKNLVFIIKAKQEFIRFYGDEKKKNAPLLNSLFESISETYIPLLNMFDNLEKDDIPCKMGLVLPPLLCTLLEDSEIQDMYLEYLEKQILLGQSEIERCKEDSFIIENIHCKIKEVELLKLDFVEKYNKNLIKAFADYMNKGYVELLATCGTDIFIPHFSDMKEVISAQIETGLHAYREAFGEIPDGFWLPELGYRPGIEKIIKAYGFTYTILDSRSVLLSDNIPTNGIFYPVRTENFLVLFANDFSVENELYGEDGIVHSLPYRNENRDIGFELPMENLKLFLDEKGIRYSTGYKYWNRCFNNQNNSYYSIEAAKEQAMQDAKMFLKRRVEKLNKAAELTTSEDFVTLVCTFDAGKLKDNWHEAIYWFECLFRTAKTEPINIATCNEMLSRQYQLEKHQPCYASSAGAGYGENLLSSKNSWMMRYIRKASERMVDLADRFPNDTGLKTRLLNLGVKQLLVAQSLNIAKSIDDDDFPTFAKERFTSCIEGFTTVFDSLGSNVVSTEWLTTLENKDNFYPWMNYRIFSKKK
jgi:1,4-alpha-glucan branching enzyme